MISNLIMAGYQYAKLFHTHRQLWIDIHFVFYVKMWNLSLNEKLDLTPKKENISFEVLLFIFFFVLKGKTWILLNNIKISYNSYSYKVRNFFHLWYSISNWTSVLTIELKDEQKYWVSDRYKLSSNGDFPWITLIILFTLIEYY